MHFLNHCYRHSLTLIRVLSLALPLISGCGSSSKAEKPISQSVRTGRANTSVDAKYIDGEPSVSASGTKIVFTSGRDGGTPRIYKTSFDGTSWSTPEKLSASSGMTSENIAKVSPDSNWVLVQGATSTGQALAMCSYASGTCDTVTTTPWGLGSFEFNGDSTMFFYLSGVKSSGATMTVASVSATPTGNQVGASDSWTDAFWSANASPNFSLTAAKKSATPGQKTLTIRTFTSPSTAASATATNFSADISYGATIGHNSGTSSLVAIGAPIAASTDKVFTELGTIDSATKKSIPLRNELHTWTVAGTDQGAVTASTGFEIMSASVAADDSTIFTLNRIATRCAGDSDSTWGFAMALITRSDQSVTWRHLKKPTDLSLAPTISTDPCDRVLNGAATTFDFGVSEMSVNRSATQSAHTVVWTSDMTGDPEIFASISSAGSTTTYAISRNRVQ